MSKNNQIQHFLSIEDLSEPVLIELLDDAQAYIDAGLHRYHQLDTLADQTVVNLFFEQSTRTRISFQLAARRLGAEVINFDRQSSSLHKGESLLDTIITLQAMHCNFFVIRHHQNGFIDEIASQVDPTVKLINAGDGTHAHPSQALLDLLTIRQFKLKFSALRVAIVGDVAHSRVANSQIAGLIKLGVKDIRLIGPPQFLPKFDHYPSVVLCKQLEQGITDVDVIILLRVQKERHNGDELLDLDDYFNNYGLTESKLTYAKPDVIVMHPGPINRQIEIDASVAYGPHSVIQAQISNGIAVRMAIMHKLHSFNRTHYGTSHV